MIDIGGKELVTMNSWQKNTALLHITCWNDASFNVIKVLINVGGKDLIMAKNSYGHTVLCIASLITYAITLIITTTPQKKSNSSSKLLQIERRYSKQETITGKHPLTSQLNGKHQLKSWISSAQANLHLPFWMIRWLKHQNQI